MKSGAPTNVEFDNFGGLGREFSPMSEFYNMTTATDWLFVSALQSAQVNFGDLNITGGFLVGANLATEGVGTNGIIVDNNASTTAFPQAASVYFDALQENAACNNNTNGTSTGGCAVKTNAIKSSVKRGLKEQIWWTRQGSNLRPPACKAGALPAELRAHSLDWLQF
jgi:hypothetical protein